MLRAKDEASAKIEKFNKRVDLIGKGAIAAGGGLVALATGAFKLGEQFDSAFDKMRIGTGKSGEALEGLQQSFRNVFGSLPTDMASASTAITELHKRTGMTGEGLEHLTRQSLELTRLFGGDLSENIRLSTRLFGDWGIEATETTKTLDKIAKASQVTGVKVDALMATVVQFGAPLRAMNFSFEESIALLGKWEREGVNSELVLGSLRIAMGNFARDNVPMREGLEKTIKRIQELGPSAEATALAMDIFGARAGPDMAAAILEGRFAIEKEMAAMEAADGTIQELAKDTEDSAEKMSKAWNRFQLAAEPIVSKVFAVLGEALDNASMALEAITNIGLENFIRKLVSGIPVLREFVALVEGFNKVQDIMNPFRPDGAIGRRLQAFREPGSGKFIDRSTALSLGVADVSTAVLQAREAANNRAADQRAEFKFIKRADREYNRLNAARVAAEGTPQGQVMTFMREVLAALNGMRVMVDGDELGRLSGYGQVQTGMLASRFGVL